MSNTKELILITALRLFARDGYEAVSVSTIAGELGLVKSALYKHYKNKQDIFDSILRRMEELDNSCAVENDMRQQSYSTAPEAYISTPISQIKAFTRAMFIHWTEDEFPALFRRLLSIQRHRSKEMARLYQQYLSAGPLADAGQ